MHLPSKSTLAREFDWGGGSAQCLIKDGQPLRLQPFPEKGRQTYQAASRINAARRWDMCRSSIT
jgi:hypothetical protein